MKIKNKKTGYIFEISDIEGRKILEENPEEFEPLNKKDMPKVKKEKTIREKVMGVSCLKSLTKEQIIQELEELSVKFNPKSKKDSLIELLQKAGGC